MNKVIGIFIVATMFTSCSEAQVKTERVSKKVKTEVVQKNIINKVVKAEEFKILLDKKDVQLVDVRTAGEVAGGKIGDAINIDYFGDNFKTEIAKLDRSKPVLVYCKSGGRSGESAQILKGLGFIEVYDLKGGYSKWPFK